MCLTGAFGGGPLPLLFVVASRAGRLDDAAGSAISSDPLCVEVLCVEVLCVEVLFVEALWLRAAVCVDWQVDSGVGGVRWCRTGRPGRRPPALRLAELPRARAFPEPFRRMALGAADAEVHAFDSCCICAVRDKSSDLGDSACA